MKIIYPVQHELPPGDEMFDDAVIIFDHDGPIESTVIAEVLSAISIAVRRGNELFLRDFLNDPTTDSKLFANAKDKLDKDKQDVVYLSTSYTVTYKPETAGTAPAKVTLYVKIRRVALAALAGSAALVLGPAVGDTQVAKDIRGKFVEQTDKYYRDIREFLGVSTAGREIETRTDGNTIIMIIKLTPEEKARHNQLKADMSKQNKTP